MHYEWKFEGIYFLYCLSVCLWQKTLTLAITFEL